MMWDKSKIYNKKCNEEISNFYTNLGENQKLFDKFVTYIKNLQSNYGEKQICFDFIAGMETSYLVFNNEIEQLNRHVACTAGSLRRFSEIREPSQANSEWDELCKQIRTLIELLNCFLSKCNITDNATTCSKYNQHIHPFGPTANNYTQTGRNSSFVRRTSQFSDEAIESELLGIALVEDQNRLSFNCDTPQVTGPIRRLRTRHQDSTTCCSCGKSKVANKSTQTKSDSKKDKSCGCCCCVCSKDDSKDSYKGDKCWVTVYDIQTQTSSVPAVNECIKSRSTQYSNKDLLNENIPECDDVENCKGKMEPSYSYAKQRTSSIISQGLNEQIKLKSQLTQYSNKDLINKDVPECNDVENFKSKIESSFCSARKPTSSIISPTPYGVSSNSLPVNGTNQCAHNLTPMEENIKLLLKLLEEIEKSLCIVKQLHDTLLQQTGMDHIINNAACDDTNLLESKNRDINLHLTITLEKNSPLNNANIELNQDCQKLIAPSRRSSGKGLSSFFKRKCSSSSLKHESNQQTTLYDQQIQCESDSIKSGCINDPNLQIQGDIEKNCENTQGNSRLSEVNRYSSVKSNPRDSIKMRSSFSNSFNKNDYTLEEPQCKIDGERRSSINHTISKDDGASRICSTQNNKSTPRDTINSTRRSSFKHSLHENDPEFTKSLLSSDPDRTSDSDNKNRTSFQSNKYENNPNLEGSRNNKNSLISGGDCNKEEYHRKSCDNRRSSFQTYLYQSNLDLEKCHNNDPHFRPSGSGNSIRRSSFQQGSQENIHDLDERYKRHNEGYNRKTGDSNRTSSIQYKCENNSMRKSPSTTQLRMHSSRDRNHEFRKAGPSNINRTSSVNENDHGPCRCCENNHMPTNDKSCTQNVDTFRCPTCQHRCVYCKSCFEMHETLYNCLKHTREESKHDQLMTPCTANATPLRNDKNFWAEAMLYFIPNFLASLRKDSKSENIDMTSQNCMSPTLQKSPQIDKPRTLLSESSSPECDRKPKYKWVLIRVDYFEDGARQINLINDTDIPENSYLTASK